MAYRSPSGRIGWPSSAGTGAATNPRPSSRRNHSAASIAARNPANTAGLVRPSQPLSSRSSTVTNHRRARPALDPPALDPPALDPPALGPRALATQW
jgi:hypothetical protein